MIALLIILGFLGLKLLILPTSISFTLGLYISFLNNVTHDNNNLYLLSAYYNILSTRCTYFSSKLAQMVKNLPEMQEI